MIKLNRLYDSFLFVANRKPRNVTFPWVIAASWLASGVAAEDSHEKMADNSARRPFSLQLFPGQGLEMV